MSVNCPWCNATFSYQQKKDFWGHVYREHEFSAEDVAFALALELSTVQERVEELEHLVPDSDSYRLPGTPSASSSRSSSTPSSPAEKVAPWHQVATEKKDEDPDLESRPEFYF
jgi:hypothetical protein